MRIAIITQPLRYNYGGILQNFALQTVLKAMGHKVVTLDSEVKGKQNVSRKIFKFLRGIFLFLRDSKGRFLGIYTYQTASEKRSQNTIMFIRKYINVCSLKYYNENDFKLKLERTNLTTVSACKINIPLLQDFAIQLG